MRVYGKEAILHLRLMNRSLFMKKTLIFISSESFLRQK